MYQPTSAPSHSRTRDDRRERMDRNRIIILSRDLFNRAGVTNEEARVLRSMSKDDLLSSIMTMRLDEMARNRARESGIPTMDEIVRELEKLGIRTEAESKIEESMSKRGAEDREEDVRLEMGQSKRQRC